MSTRLTLRNVGSGSIYDDKKNCQGKWEHANFYSRIQPTQIGLGISSTDSSMLELDYTYLPQDPLT